MPLVQGLRMAWAVPRGRAGLTFLGFLVLLALMGPHLLPDPFRQFDLIELASSPPSAEHPFGTDQLSRDVLSRVVSGARVSLAVAALAVALSLTLGAGGGLIAGYWGLDKTNLALADLYRPGGRYWDSAGWNGRGGGATA